MISISPHEEGEQTCGMNLARTLVVSRRISRVNRVAEAVGEPCLFVMVSFLQERCGLG